MLKYIKELTVVDESWITAWASRGYFVLLSEDSFERSVVVSYKSNNNSSKTQFRPSLPAYESAGKSRVCFGCSYFLHTSPKYSVLLYFEQ